MALRFFSLLIGALLSAPPAFAAGGAYVVDDSEIGAAGECKLETWAAAARDREWSFVAAPACVVSFVEVGAALDRSRADGAWATSVSPKAKATLLPVERHGIGVGIAAGAGIATRTRKADTLAAQIPVSWQPVSEARINLNLGWERDRTVPRDTTTFGAGTDVQIREDLTAIAEVFGRDRGARPGMQVGIRPTLLDGRLDLDLILGRNVTQARSNRITLGATLRF